MHYEIEQAGDGSEHRPGSGPHAVPKRWRMVRVLNADAAPMPLRFDTLERALAYTMTVPPDVAPGGGVGRLTSGSGRARLSLLASRLPGRDRRMSSGPRGGDLSDIGL